MLGDIQPHGHQAQQHSIYHPRRPPHVHRLLETSRYGSTDPVVYVNVITDLSNLTTAEFFAPMPATDLLLPLNNSMPQVVNAHDRGTDPDVLDRINPQDPYRGLDTVS